MRSFDRTLALGRLLSGLLVAWGVGVVVGEVEDPLGQVTLSWEASSEPGVTGYKVYYGTESWSYGDLLDAGASTVVQLSGLSEGTTYYCNVTAYNSVGLEGGFSEEVQFIYEPFSGDRVEIGGQSESQAVGIGNGVTLEVSAVGSGPLSYQWFKDGVAIPGATDSSLVFEEVEVGDTGSYSAVVSSGEASVTTSPTMLVAALDAPRITAFGRMVGEGGEPLVVLDLDGGVESNIHVFASPDLGSWEHVSSQYNETGTITFSDPASGSARRFYRVAASADLPVITGSPQSRAIGIGGSTTLSVEVTAQGEVSYQWLKDGIDIPGATSASLELADVQHADGGSYSVVVTTGTASTATGPVVVVAAIEAPRITSLQRLADPGGGLVRFDFDGGAGSHIHVFASEDLENWEWLGSEYNATGTISVSDPDSGTSPRRFYRVAASADQPVINQAPQSQAVLIGGSATLSVDASADGALSYQWLKDGAEIAGATGASLELTDLQADDGGSYSVVVSSLSGSTATTPITLVAADTAPRITSLLRFSYEDEHFVRLGLDGAEGATIYVFASGDLEHWELLSSQPNENGSVVASDPQSASSSQRFYRVAASGTGDNPPAGK